MKPRPRYQIEDKVIYDDHLCIVVGGMLKKKEWYYLLDKRELVHMGLGETTIASCELVVSEGDLMVAQQEYGPKYTWEFQDNGDGTGQFKGSLTSRQ